MSCIPRRARGDGYLPATSCPPRASAARAPPSRHRGSARSMGRCARALWTTRRRTRALPPTRARRHRGGGAAAGAASGTSRPAAARVAAAAEAARRRRRPPRRRPSHMGRHQTAEAAEPSAEASAAWPHLAPSTAVACSPTAQQARAVRPRRAGVRPAPRAHALCGDGRRRRSARGRPRRPTARSPTRRARGAARRMPAEMQLPTAGRRWPGARLAPEPAVGRTRRRWTRVAGVGIVGVRSAAARASHCCSTRPASRHLCREPREYSDTVGAYCASAATAALAPPTMTTMAGATAGYQRLGGRYGAARGSGGSGGGGGSKACATPSRRPSLPPAAPVAARRPSADWVRRSRGAMAAAAPQQRRPQPAPPAPPISSY